MQHWDKSALFLSSEPFHLITVPVAAAANGDNCRSLPLLHWHCATWARSPSYLAVALSNGSDRMLSILTERMTQPRSWSLLKIFEAGCCCDTVGLFVEVDKVMVTRIVQHPQGNRFKGLATGHLVSAARSLRQAALLPAGVR